MAGANVGQARQRIVVRRGAVLVINGLEVDSDILREMVNPRNRLLWAFVRNAAGDVQPIPYDETRVVWL